MANEWDDDDLMELEGDGDDEPTEESTTISEQQGRARQSNRKDKKAIDHKDKEDKNDNDEVEQTNGNEGKRKFTPRRAFSVRFEEMRLGEEHSAFVCSNKTLSYPLLPAAIGQERNVITQVMLHRWKGNYMPQLDGVLCYFDKLTIVDQRNEIRDDLPYIYVHFNADFYVFRPTVGSLARAKITCFLEENNVLNCTIADCFNSTISLPDEIPEKLVEYLVLNQEIIFRISEVCYNPLNVYGSIDKKCIKMIRKQIPLLTLEETEKIDDNNLDDFFVS